MVLENKTQTRARIDKIIANVHTENIKKMLFSHLLKVIEGASKNDDSYFVSLVKKNNKKV